LRLSLAWYSLLNVGFALAILAAAKVGAIGVLRIPTTETGQALVLFLGAIPMFALSNYAGVYGAVLQGAQHADRLYISYSIARVAYLVGLGITVVTGVGALGVVASSLLLYLLQLAQVVPSAQHILGRAGARMSPGQLREHIAFGWHAYLAGLSDFIVLQFPKIIATVTLGARGVAVTDLLYRLPLVFAGAAYPISATVVPAAARLVALDRAAELDRLVSTSSRYVALATLPLFGVLGFASPMLLVILGGAELVKFSGLMPVLCFAFASYAISSVPLSVMMGGGQSAAVVRYKLIVAAATASTTTVGAVIAGIPGIVAGSALALALGVLCLFPAIGMTLGRSSSRRFAMSMVRPIVVLAFATVVGWIVLVGPAKMPSVAAPICFIIAFAVGAILAGLVTRDDRETLTSAISRSGVDPPALR
jgi:O-antigen/teichoic acid export membrane protein